MNALPQQGRRIVWLVRMLTSLGLALVILTTGLLGWTLAHIRQERAQVVAEQDQLDRATQALRDTAASSRFEFQTLLDETMALPKQPVAAAHFDELLHTQMSAKPDAAVLAALNRLEAHAHRLINLAAAVVAWRTNYSPVWEDLHHQRTMMQVRNQITQLRGAVEILEGRRRLEEAKNYRRWRTATGAEAARLAEAILVDQGGQQSRNAADFKAQLAELAQLVELLGGEEEFDNLADLKDNKLKPALDRLSHAVWDSSSSGAGADGLPRESIENLRVALLGNEPVNDAATHKGLFALRRDVLQLRREREQLKNTLTDLFQEIESANFRYAQSTQARTSELTQQMERSLMVGWRRWLLFSGGFCGLFLWLAWFISRGINAQVKALDHARAEAEAGRQTTQQLMAGQQAATAELAAAHQGLKASELRFRTLSASAPIGIFLSDAKGRALYFNPHWLGITGLTLEESLGEGWQKALHPDDAAGMLAARKDAAKRGWGYSHEFRIRRPSGEVRWVHARSVVIRSESGNISGYVGTTEDITERRRSEESLRLQEAALRSAANVVVITDRSGDIVWTNPAFTKVTGYTAAEALGKNPRVLRRAQGPSSYPANYYQDLWKTIFSGEVWHGEFHNVRKDGSPLIEEATITPVRNDKGEISHFVAVKQDITARKRAEEELAQAQKDLLEVSRQAGMAEVATGVLHNVGNVLNSVNVGASCMAEGFQKSKLPSLAKVVALLQQEASDLGGFFGTDPRGKQLPGYLEQLAHHLAQEQAFAIAELAGVQKHIEHIKQIVAMQQSFAKVSGVKEVLSAPHLVEDALQMNLSSIERHEIEVIKDFHPAPLVVAEKHKALQILVNLIRNAKQACDGADRDDKRVTLQILAISNRVRINVSDNGVGIPQENLVRVFNHGFTTKKDGHGFGLHSGANAAKEMGGDLSVHSAGTGHGATFTLELPAQASTPSL